jgi:hypothetical protein
MRSAMAPPGGLAPVYSRRPGTEIQRSHQGLHAGTADAIRAFLARYTAADLSVLTRVLADLSRMPREGVTFRPDLLD